MGHHGAMALSTGEPREAVIDFSPDPAPGAKLVTDFPAGLIYVVRSGGGEIYKHVNSSFRVKDPSGNIMVESESVHSHTGVFNIMQSFASPGIYTLEVEAGSMYPGTFSPVRETFDFEVSDPGELGNAALEVSTEGFIANKLTEITIAVSDPASGEGLKHSSFNVLVLRMGQRLLQTRLHTHTGVATFRYRFPSAGSYVIEVTALPTPGDTQYNYPATNIRKTVTVSRSRE
jgi:hypothetical protein